MVVEVTDGPLFQTQRAGVIVAAADLRHGQGHFHAAMAGMIGPLLLPRLGRAFKRHTIRIQMVNDERHRLERVQMLEIKWVTEDANRPRERGQNVLSAGAFPIHDVINLVNVRRPVMRQEVRGAGPRIS